MSKILRKTPLRIALTTGDSDGIGAEVTAKALSKVGAQSGVIFYLWRAPRCSPKLLHLIDRKFKRITVNTWPEALKVKIESSRQIVDISSNLPPPLWVETTAQAAHFGHIDGMATAPLSKTAIASAGLKDLGHTGILKRITKARELFMGFVGDYFNVVLATGHVPIDKVSNELTALRLTAAVQAAEQLRRVLAMEKRLKTASHPLALLGLNPHAGEAGLIGTTEIDLHQSVIEIARRNGIKIDGPLVPDAAFFKANWKKYSVFIANYHDQGLIPFKMIHGQESGIHITLGLPFIRTSVDHGTAKDIFGTGKADPSSMRLAIEWALKLALAKEKSP